MESVPPLLYGGTERIVSYLTEELGPTWSRGDPIRECGLYHRRRAGGLNAFVVSGLVSAEVAFRRGGPSDKLLGRTSEGACGGAH
jgi:hypothetical protein